MGRAWVIAVALGVAGSACSPAGLGLPELGSFSGTNTGNGGTNTGNGGTNTGNAGTNTGNAITFSSLEGSNDTVTLDAQGTAFTFSDSRAYVKTVTLHMDDQVPCSSLELEAPVTCNKARIIIDVNRDVDFISGTQFNAKVPALAYDLGRVRMANATVDALDAGDPLATHTIYAAGSFDYRGETITFDLVHNFDNTFEVPDRFVVESEETKIQFLFDIRQWFDQLPITDCLDRGILEIENGHLSMPSTNNCDTGILIRRAIMDSARIAIQ